MKRIILFIFITTIVFSSCNKDETNTDPSPQESVLDYFPINVGNYWVYEISGCDSTWTDCNIIRIDTVKITKDTIISGTKYFKFQGSNPINYGSSGSFLRDSLQYIVNNFGDIIMSNTDFESIIGEQYIVNQDTLYYWYSKMQEEFFEVRVPVGYYKCLDKRLSFFRHDENFEHEFNTHVFYAKNIGPVYNNWMYASSTAGLKQELVDFRIIPNNSMTSP